MSPKPFEQHAREQVAQDHLQKETLARSDAETARTAETAQRRIAETQRSEADKMRNQAEANFRQARRAVDDMYTQFAEKWLVNQPQLQPMQREFLQKALRFYAEFAQQTGTDAAIRLETAARTDDLQRSTIDWATSSRPNTPVDRILSDRKDW